MKCLAVDTSNSHLTVALIEGDKVTSEYLDDTNLRHSTILMTSIEKVLNSAGAKLSDIDFFACVVGPGSFTGIRIGISTIKAFSYANNKPVLPITSFEVLEYNRPYGKNIAVIDARHDNYYAMGYDNDKVVIEPSFLYKDEILKLKGEYEILSSTKNDIATVECSLLDGLVNAVKAKVNSVTDRESLLPLYVKKSQAEEGL
ncbi:MAG: tRNA (adenosine(37)-N6)-threonylcarbamoyltransferase complex dimerization subunit type 1 TsaB [Clostridia bacterium]|nr:tRNA (adenosine(37)-N6)-threonylcarbamoyltransferase complex dimerization subunit type 1 TsaB [Clostridia bacterium]